MHVLKLLSLLFSGQFNNFEAFCQTEVKPEKIKLKKTKKKKKTDANSNSKVGRKTLRN